MNDKDYCERALRNLEEALRVGLKFPMNVFRGSWSEFFFFDSDWMFDGDFVVKVQALLNMEGSSCACMSNLDVDQGESLTKIRSFFIESSTEGVAYELFLNGPKIGEGWIYGVDRFGCTSNVGEWCFYCERANEIAVIAIQRSARSEKYKPVIEKLKALPIEQAIHLSLSYGFSSRVITPEWSRQLTTQYVTRGN